MKTFLFLSCNADGSHKEGFECATCGTLTRVRKKLGDKCPECGSVIVPYYDFTVAERIESQAYRLKQNTSA